MEGFGWEGDTDSGVTDEMRMSRKARSPDESRGFAVCGRPRLKMAVSKSRTLFCHEKERCLPLLINASAIIRAPGVLLSCQECPIYFGEYYGEGQAVLRRP